MENKSTSVNDLWKEEPNLASFPAKVLRKMLDLKELESEIGVKADLLLQRIEKRKEYDRQKKEEANNEIKRQK